MLLVLGVPSILAGAYAGIEAVDRRTIDAARAMGMTDWQMLWKVEIPLGLPLLLGGLRNATLQIVATATLAAYIGLGGLGVYIFDGLGVRDFTEMLAGAILVAALALVARRALRAPAALRGAARCRGAQHQQRRPLATDPVASGDGNPPSNQEEDEHVHS